MSVFADLNRILSDGVVKIAVPESFAPFGFVGKTGEHEGYDVDVAKLIAKDLNVTLELVPVVSKQRIPFLETDKETYRFADVDNVYPVIGARDARFDTGGSPLSEIGVAFPQGTHVAGVEADRIKFKIKLTSGQADLRNEYYSTFTGASGFREWNRFRGRGRRDADFADIYDYSVNFHGFRFYFTQNNVLLLLKYLYFLYYHYLF